MAVRGAQVVYNSSLLFAQQYANANYGQGIFGQSTVNGVLTGGTPNMISGSSTLPVQWVGGKTVVSFEGTIPAGLVLQQLLPGGSWSQVGSGVLSTTIATPQMITVDLAFGQYRLFNNSASAFANTYVQLSAVPYGL